MCLLQSFGILILEVSDGINAQKDLNLKGLSFGQILLKQNLI